MNKKELIEVLVDYPDDVEIETLIYDEYNCRLDGLDVDNYDNLKIKKIEVTFE